ncbi:flagellin [Thermosulfidibacter takaii ABI70S6]|uniref:Flagellin n=1 Tax=Thermosulfidibacter takaii (strain DSM 17441 / JCM 13301 / NBRC 103674 / ABI70S6) TaxID=1298851 RepID=A0A0S3QVK8_THET7|nr:flagellin [Thermosulfidibacter takaii]BAT72362.1 flagellin [Thermosulfidibacter takaii ABI70S6]
MRVEGVGLLSQLRRYMEELNRTSQKIATGKSIHTAADNPAMAAVAEKMNAIIKELQTRQGNLRDIMNLTKTAEGGLSNISDILQRMRELAVQASNGTLTEQDRAHIQAKFNQLKEELNRIANTTQFNQQRLLDINTEKLGLKDIDLTNPKGTETALSRLDNALKTVTSERADLGATINAYQKRLSNYQVQARNTIEAYSRITDADIAQAITQYTNYQTLTQVAITNINKMKELMLAKLNLLG